MTDWLWNLVVFQKIICNYKKHLTAIEKCQREIWIIKMHDSRMGHLDMLASLLNPRNWEQQKHFCHVVMVMKRKSQLDVEKTAL